MNEEIVQKFESQLDIGRIITQEEEDAGNGYCEDCRLCRFVLIQLCQKEEEFQCVMRLSTREEVIEAIDYFLRFRQYDVFFSDLAGSIGLHTFHQWTKEKEQLRDKEWMQEINEELRGIQIYSFNCKRMKM